MKTTQLLTVEEVANVLKCHPQTVRRWIWSGKLAHIKVGGLVRVAEGEVRALLERSGKGDRRRTTGIAALRTTMQKLRRDVTAEDIDELTRKIVEGEQPAEWDSPVD